MTEATRERTSRSKGKADDLQTLNFKVPRAFKKAFKLYAVEREISMIDLLREGFELSKKTRKP